MSEQTGAPRPPILWIGEPSSPLAHGVLEGLRARGWAVRIHPVDDPPSVRPGDFDRVVGCGGDGSVARAAALAAECGLSLAAVPAGTANDWARAVGLPTHPDALVDVILGPTLPLDMARTAAGEWVLNAASMGAGAQVTAETPARLKAWLGVLAYPLFGLLSPHGPEPFEVHVRTPGTVWRGEALAVCVANGQTAGGHLAVAPHALLDDGRLDVLVVPALEQDALGALMHDLTRPAWDTAFEHLVYRQAPEVEVAFTDGPRLVTLDGEPREVDGLALEAVPHAVDAHVPPGPLFASTQR